MNNHNVKLDEEFYRKRTEINSTYLPINYSEYTNKTLKIRVLKIVLLILCAAISITGIMTFILAIYLVFNIRSLILYDLSIDNPLIVTVILLFAFIIQVIIAYKINSKCENLLKNINLISIGNRNDFVELNLHGYQNVKELTVKDAAFKEKIVQILDLRGGKILAFDYHQLKTDALIEYYDQLNNVKKNENEIFNLIDDIKNSSE
jgi:hypothetical protein